MVDGCSKWFPLQGAFTPRRNGPNGLLHVQPLRLSSSPTVLEDDLDADGGHRNMLMQQLAI